MRSTTKRGKTPAMQLGLSVQVDKVGTDIHMYMEYRKGDGPWKIQRAPRCTRCNGTGWQEEQQFVSEENGHPEGTILIKIDCWLCDGTGRVHIHRDEENNLVGGRVFYGRNYVLFGALAGVRGDRAPLIEPRGMPPDPSPEYTELAAWSDAHSHSWLSLTDVAAILIEEDTDQFGLDIGWHPTFMEVVRRMERIAKVLGPDNVRIVFFFDN